MLMDKGIFDETHPSYLGMYLGHQADADVWRFIENCDCVLAIGALFTDTTSMGETVQLDQSKLIEIMPHATRINTTLYKHVEMRDLLEVLIERLPVYAGSMGPEPADAPSVDAAVVEESAALTADYLYERWSALLRPGDTVLAEWGTIILEFSLMHLPADVTLLNDGLWSSIGWATPAAFGAALADPDRRVLLFTGEGAHQMTAQEVAQIARQGLKPIIFVLNNSGYLVERLTGGAMANYYNDLAPWNYQALANALGCTNWMTAQVRTCGELDQAIKQAETCGTGAYIEVIVNNSVVTTSALEAIMSAHVYARRD
jgi:indolepyruvate decarboxylase